MGECNCHARSKRREGAFVGRSPLVLPDSTLVLPDSSLSGFTGGGPVGRPGVDAGGLDTQPGLVMGVSVGPRLLSGEGVTAGLSEGLARCECRPLNIDPVHRVPGVGLKDRGSFSPVKINPKFLERTGVDRATRLRVHELVTLLEVTFYSDTPALNKRRGRGCKIVWEETSNKRLAGNRVTGRGAHNRINQPRDRTRDFKHIRPEDDRKLKQYEEDTRICGLSQMVTFYDYIYFPSDHRDCRRTGEKDPFRLDIELKLLGPGRRNKCRLVKIRMEKTCDTRRRVNNRRAPWKVTRADVDIGPLRNC